MSAVLPASGLSTSEASATRPVAEPVGFFAYHGIWAPGVRLFRRLRFLPKALIVSLSFMVPTTGLVLWMLFMQSEHGLRDRMNATRQHVEVAHGVIAWAHAQEASGKMGRADAQKMALAAIAALRYDKNEYFWVNDMQPRMLMHPIKKELDGQLVGSVKDPNGFALFEAFVATVRKDGKGFVSYQWPKPGHVEPVDKVSYVQGFEPWGWVVGSGAYVDDLRVEFMRYLVTAGVIVLLGCSVAGYLFLCFYRVMDGGLRETRRHLHAMTEGDLTTSPSPWGKDEAAQLMLELRAMQDSLRSVVRRVRMSSDRIVTSSSEIAHGAMELSHRTESAAANLEESAASMEEISATVSNTAEHTSEAAEVARQNAQVAAEGGRVMREVVETMEAISGSSRRIGEIIGTIDGIAFQTNILALNAAVEAARAGEQGRGFAVVANEVRMLAQRSAEAAREIKALISTSVDQVEAGGAIVRKAGMAIEEIVTSSQRVDQILSEVATGANEQRAGISQIGQAVQELDRMTQENAALVEETAAGASTMKEQAHELAAEVAHFRMP